MRRKTITQPTLDFDKTQLIDAELIDKVSLWALRVILKLDGAKEFINKHNEFSKDSLAYFLDVGNYTEIDRDEFKRSDVLNALKQKHKKLEQKKRFTSAKILTKNIKQISKLMELNRYEEEILEFAVILNQFELLDDIGDLLGRELNTTQVKKVISIMLNIPGIM